MSEGRYRILKLKKLYDDLTKHKLDHLLNSFSSRDQDVEYFLRHLALQNEIDKKTITVLFMDTKLTKIMAYFTIKQKSLSLIGFSELEKKQIGDIRGDESSLSAILLAQLSKDKVHGKNISGEYLWDVINQYINFGLDFRTKFVLVDCKKELMGYYEAKGFNKIANDNLNNLKTYIINSKLLSNKG